MARVGGQRTLKTACRLSGIGLHTGVRTSVVLEPAPEGHGIRFVRGDVPGAKPLEATVAHVVETPFHTTLGCSRWQVGTVEHLMAALCGCGVDNLTVVVYGPEVPILDGSAWPFVEAVDETGMVETPIPRQQGRLMAPVVVTRGERTASAQPAERPSWACTVQFEHPGIGTQHAEVSLETFRTSIARARTFGLLADVAAMRRQGFAQGGTLQNALVMGAEGWVNPERVRYPDEPVRHKLVDMMGDTLLIGFPVVARIEAYRPGHALIHDLMGQILSAGSSVLERFRE